MRQSIIIALAASFSLWGSVWAQEKYPNKPVTIIVPQAAGGANDAIARVVAQKLTEQTGQSFVVENRAGAGGNVGTAAAAKAKPDGYTLMITADSAQVINPFLYQRTGFDPVKDFEPVAPLARAGYVLVANPSFPANNMSEFIAQAKANPGKFAIASAGNGTLNHLLGEMLNSMAGIQLQHVPYKGVAPAMNDVLGGQLPFVFASLPASLSHIKAGKLKALAVSSPKRSPALPDVPALSEAVPGYAGTLWIGLFSPAGVPAEVSAKLGEAMGKTLAAKDLRDKLEQQGVELAAPTTPEQFANLLNDDIVRWGQIVKSSGASID